MLKSLHPLLEILNQGGAVMWVLLGISLLMLSIILNRSVYWLKFWKRYVGARKALKQTQNSQSFKTHQKCFNHCFQVPIDSLFTVPYDKILIQAEYLEAQWTHRSVKGHQFLSVFVTISPLLGILGTVLGIVVSFKVLSAKSMQDPSLLSAGIAQALLTTIFGLIIAVIAYTAFSLFNALLEKMQFRFSQLVSQVQLLRSQEGMDT